MAAVGEIAPSLCFLALLFVFIQPDASLPCSGRHLKATSGVEMEYILYIYAEICGFSIQYVDFKALFNP